LLVTFPNGFKFSRKICLFIPLVIFGETHFSRPSHHLLELFKLSARRTAQETGKPPFMEVSSIKILIPSLGRYYQVVKTSPALVYIHYLYTQSSHLFALLCFRSAALSASSIPECSSPPPVDKEHSLHMSTNQPKELGSQSRVLKVAKPAVPSSNPASHTAKIRLSGPSSLYDMKSVRRRGVCMTCILS
jgi:hypothetical protein